MITHSYKLSNVCQFMVTIKQKNKNLGKKILKKSKKSKNNYLKIK